MGTSVLLIALFIYSNSYANFCSGLLTKVYQSAANYTTDSVKILDKLKGNDPLGFLEKTWIKTEVKHIPFPEQRISILEKIKNKQPLSDIELNNISLYVGTKYKNKYNKQQKKLIKFMKAQLNTISLLLTPMVVKLRWY